MVPPRSGSSRKHLPTIATGVVIVWLVAVCVYSTTGQPASARRAGSRRFVTTALGGEAPKTRPFERRSRPLRVDVEPAQSPTPSRPKPTRKPARKSERSDAKKKPKVTKVDDPAREVGHSLPVEPALVSESELSEPHHDYPALDLSLKSGTPVYAVTSGRVQDTTGWGACGKGVIIKGKDGFTYTYCHGTRRTVGRGRWVNAGDRILLSGNTGDSTGPHLHLQIRTPYRKLVCPQHLLGAWMNGHKKSPWKAGRHGCFTGGHRHNHRKKRR